MTNDCCYMLLNTEAGLQQDQQSHTRISRLVPQSQNTVQSDHATLSMQVQACKHLHWHQLQTNILVDMAPLFALHCRTKAFPVLLALPETVPVLACAAVLSPLGSAAFAAPSDLAESGCCLIDSPDEPPLASSIS